MTVIKFLCTFIVIKMFAPCNLARYTTNLLANESPTNPFIYLLSDAKPIRFTPTFFDPINYKLVLQRIPRHPSDTFAERTIGQRALIGIAHCFRDADFSYESEKFKNETTTLKGDPLSVSLII